MTKLQANILIFIGTIIILFGNVQFWFEDDILAPVKHDIKAHEKQLQETHELMLQFNEEITAKIEILNLEVFPPVTTEYPIEIKGE